MTLGRILKSEGYNLRERLNIYGGMILGATLPAVFIRYGCEMKPMNDDWKTHLACGLFAVGMAIPVMIVTVPFGASVGKACADSLRYRSKKDLTHHLRENNKAKEE